MLELQQISKTYEGGQTVLNQVSFSLNKGDFLYVLGGSGAGKSTLLRVLASFESPTQGQISWFGYSNKSLVDRTLIRIRRKISWIPQKLDLIPEMTVEDNLKMAFFAEPSTMAQPEEHCRDVVDHLALTHLLQKSVKSLSGGEAQRVAIARGLFRKSDLILADEPTGSQDLELTWKIMDLLVKQQLAGASVILATHDLDMVKRLRKRCAVLKDGYFKIEGGNT